MSPVNNHDCQGYLRHSRHVTLITLDRVDFELEVFHLVRVTIHPLSPSVLGSIHYPELDNAFVCRAITMLNLPNGAMPRIPPYPRFEKIFV
jgi:hypothetical protein